MAILKAMGLFDLLAAALILMAHYGIFTWRPLFAAAAWLFLKAYIYKGDFASIIDFFCGIYIIMLMFGLHSILTFIFAVYLIQKALVSMI
ncbi:hypothetical protein HN419_00805 [Candidatus Woesearchaeota archaeon]|jgi:hypothetical protein|nr:hypothetical protein [Candidatus Woesearchaeota archaeon]MBT3537463.1 hypothetical protein [Candidatus Woesearchaeota archaeon]MBT4696939.1 hypothetical protein [Candidatus Woesearchaeota archaeon]MBT4717338.1 hypothetical protein [Candidatus Woesearchaeota archaeon]MBT7106227.1 hypothetical protein [Candidatus Woesearchaeota archaeon]